MSPYQQDVISTALQEFDVQAQKGLPALAAQAIGAGAFGGGREGVQRAEYQSASDRNRAALQAQLLQQGFGQAQQLAATRLLKQQAISCKLQLAQQAPALAGQQISALTTLGGLQQVSTTSTTCCTATISTATIDATITGYTGSGFRDHFINCWIPRSTTSTNSTNT
jgi:hypothetical protein